MIVEQLNRAARELSTDHPISNRLGLILVDNAVEIILYRQCTDRLTWDSSFGQIHEFARAIGTDSLAEPEYELSDDSQHSIMTPRQRAMAKSRPLKDRLRVLEEMGDLQSLERTFIAIAHDYRNELYHAGLRHDGIVRAIAYHYFLLCCDLFVRMGHFSGYSYMISSSDKYTEVALQYLPTRDGKISFIDVDKGVMAQKLRTELPDDIAPLSATLADNIRSRIAEINENFDFLIEEDPRPVDAKTLLRTVQWLFDVTSAIEAEDLVGLQIDPDYQARCSQIADDLRRHWRQKHYTIPSEKWERRANDIDVETDPRLALHLFDALQKDMLYLDQVIASAAAALDQSIQQQIDEARGK